MLPRRTLERDAFAVEICNFHPKDHLAERRLVGRAFHEGLVEPRAEKKKDKSQTAAQKSEGKAGNMTHHRPCQPDSAKNHADRGDHDAQDDGVDDGCDHTDPEASVADSSDRSNNWIRNQGSGISGDEVGRTGRSRKSARHGSRRRSTAATELSARCILPTALVAEES